MMVSIPVPVVGAPEGPGLVTTPSLAERRKLACRHGKRDGRQALEQTQEPGDGTEGKTDDMRFVAVHPTVDSYEQLANGDDVWATDLLDLG